MAAVAAGHTVLAPNTELAAALFDAVERAHREAGREIWPTPRVRDFGGWLRGTVCASGSSTDCRHAARPERHRRARIVARGDRRRARSAATCSNPAARRVRRAARAAPCYEYGIPLRAIAGTPTLPRNRRRFSTGTGDSSSAAGCLDCISADELLAAGRAAHRRPSRGSRVRRGGPWRANGCSATAGCCCRRSRCRTRRRMPRMSAASPAAELAAIGEWARANLRADPALSRLDLRAGSASAPRGSDGCVGCGARAAALSLSTASSAAAPYAVAGGTPLAELCAGARGARAARRRHRTRCRSSSSARCCGRRNCKPAAPRPRAAALLDVQLRKRGPSEADAAAWLTRCGTRRGGARTSRPWPRCSACAAPARALEELRGNQPMSRWVAAWIAAFEAGPWALRHRWSSLRISSGGAISRIAGDARDGRLVLRHALAPVGAAVFCGARRARLHFRRRPAFRRSG